MNYKQVKLTFVYCSLFFQPNLSFTKSKFYLIPVKRKEKKFKINNSPKEDEIFN